MAWLQLLTWVGTYIINASQLAGAVTVNQTYRLRCWEALLSWVTIEARRTATDSLVIPLHTLCVGCTRVLGSTGIGAEGVDAGTCRGTLRVVSAPDDEALGVAVAPQSRGTAAVCSVTLCVTLGIGGTRVVHQAGVGTHAVVTGLVVITVRVLLAAYWEAADIWITLEADLTCANWVMVNNLTVGVWSTVAGHATHTVDARLLFGTVRVGAATRWDGDFNYLAGAIVGRYVALGTYAYHGAYWQRVHDLTSCRFVTRVQHVARVDAVLVNTRLLAGTVSIHLALWLRRLSQWWLVFTHYHWRAVRHV